MKLGPRELFLLALLLAVPLSTYWLVFRPQNNEIARARMEIEHKESMLAKLREETARNADLAAANERIRAAVQDVEARLPSNKEVEGIVRQVSDLAVEVGLEPPALKSGKPVKAALYMEQPLEMSMTGNFHSYYEFLLRVEQLPRITRVLDFKLVRDHEHDGAMKAEFTLSIYFQDAPAGPAGGSVGTGARAADGPGR